MLYRQPSHSLLYFESLTVIMLLKLFILATTVLSISSFSLFGKAQKISTDICDEILLTYFDDNSLELSNYDVISCRKEYGEVLRFKMKIKQGKSVCSIAILADTTERYVVDDSLKNTCEGIITAKEDDF